MVFADLFFIYVFLPCFALLYAGAALRERKTGKTALRNAVLLVFSLFFYAWGEPVYILLLIACVALSYVCARVHRELMGIVLQLLVLAIFKYGRLLLGTAGVALPEEALRLPIGISFYTFQSISYLADVRAGRVEPQKSFSRLLTYISMFPQLIAGPIVRYRTVEERLAQRSVSAEDIAEGIWRFLIGLGKKVILADQLSLLVEQTLGTEPGSLSTGMAWLGLAAFSLQIYYDFSGYSDMAIGMGRCMGFAFPENFEHPYLCRSVTDFWRRWHISLGSFFRDYVYLPLGGNRVSKLKYVRNIMVVWALTGLWHGASWNFLLWGVYFGVLLLLERVLYYRKSREERGGILGLLRRAVSLFFIVLGWGIFYYTELGRLGAFLPRLLPGGAAGDAWLLRSLLSQNSLLLAAALIGCFRLPRLRGGGALRWGLRLLWSAAVLLIGTVLLVGASAHPFLYTRF